VRVKNCSDKFQLQIDGVRSREGFLDCEVMSRRQVDPQTPSSYGQGLNIDLGKAGLSLFYPHICKLQLLSTKHVLSPKCPGECLSLLQL
jgi:hypothetical protein